MEDAQIRDALRNVLDQAHNEGYLVIEEVNLINKFLKKLDKEIDRKTNDKLRLEGEIQQLRLTKRLIIDMVKDSVAAAERAKAREETVQRIRSGKAARETVVIEEQLVEEEEKPKARRQHTKKEEK